MGVSTNNQVNAIHGKIQFAETFMDMIEIGCVARIDKDTFLLSFDQIGITIVGSG